MSINAILRVTQLLLVLFAITAITGATVRGQRPAATPNPAQRDATRPPGQGQNQPDATRPTSPTAAPGTQRPAPQTPPGTGVVTPSTAPSSTQLPVSPTAMPTPPTGDPSATPNPTGVEPRDPIFPDAQARPLPPMPNLSRLGVTSDNSVTLTLNEAIRLALVNNNDIEVARDDVRFAETQLRAFEGVYDPVFSMTPQIDKRVTPIQNIFSGAPSGKLSTSVFTFSPGVTKSFSKGGGTYDLTFSNTRNTTSATSSTLNPFYSSNLALTIVQPLWRNRSIDNNRRNIRIQKKRIEQSDSDFRARTIDIISQVQSAYWDLLFAMRDQQVQLDNMNLSRENLRQIEAQIAAGAKAPLDRAEVLTELANRESSLLTATQNVTTAENRLKQLILKDPTANQWSAQITPTDVPIIDTTPVNLNDALGEARKNRPELARLRLQRDINDIDLKYFRNQTKPQFDLQSTVATTGLAGSANSTFDPTARIPLISGDPATSSDAFLLAQIRDIQTRAGFPLATVPLITPSGSFAPPELVGGYAKDLSNLFGFKTYNITVGVAIQFPFRNTTAKANLAGALIQKEQLDATVRSQEQFVEVDVRNAAQGVESSRLRVLAAREARKNAEIQLEGEQRLYSVGRSTTYILIQRQNALANARAAEVQAETGYAKALANLQRATSSTLRNNNVTVDSSVKP
ncbi:MAG: outer membrane protein [Blastocatellia bacterium]|jgi:HAE1 family hydrophobic/amphiphilic exporter-1|nr:outer membrane protein [Blastocatellia bacterium]